uniref:Putative ovule protein n=1 Tax=Solanum chacoense TaxID=4108 RepID=A0A0V0H8K0_SOLCH
MSDLYSRCFFCGKESDTLNHFFIHCAVTGVKWAMPKSKRDLMKCWNNRGGIVREKRCWSPIPACIWLTVRI